MTDRELMQQALEALQNLYDEQNDAPLERYRAMWEAAMADAVDTITALRERLAQPEQEPVATVESKTGNPDILMSWWHEPALPVGTKLYTAPPRREWVGLTEEDFSAINQSCLTKLQAATSAESILKEKNSAQ